VFGARDLKSGAAGTAMNLLQFPGLNHKSEIIQGIREEECGSLLKQFFVEQRARKKQPPLANPDEGFAV
jgi:tRNA(adenine34) deaminase